MQCFWISSSYKILDFVKNLNFFWNYLNVCWIVCEFFLGCRCFFKTMWHLTYSMRICVYKGVNEYVLCVCVCMCERVWMKLCVYMYMWECENASVWEKIWELVLICVWVWYVWIYDICICMRVCMWLWVIMFIWYVYMCIFM